VPVCCVPLMLMQTGAWLVPNQTNLNKTNQTSPNKTDQTKPNRTDADAGGGSWIDRRKKVLACIRRPSRWLLTV
jgi:hypothetical protein